MKMVNMETLLLFGIKNNRRNKLVYVIINNRKKRVIGLDNKLTPAFEYPSQAQRWIDKFLRGSKNLTYKKV